MNLANVLQENAQRNPGKTAIRCKGEELSYADVWSLAERTAQLLLDNGVSTGDRVGLSMAESPLHLIAHYAIARLSAVIVPMDHRWTEHEKIAAANAFDTVVVLIDGDDIDGVSTRVLSIETLPDSAATLPATTDVDCDLLLSLSSGTTGRPKGALVSHRNLYERFVSQWKAIGYGSEDSFALLTPFYFGAGRSFGMSLLAAGGTVVIAPPPMKPPQIVEVLSDTRITATFLPPTLLRRLFDSHESGEPPLFAHLNFLIVSGEPLFADEAHTCIEKICPNLYSYYASSEGGGISVLRASDFEEFAATVGKATYKTEVQIVDNDDHELPQGKVGRLRYRGPGVATRYLDSDGNEHDSAVGGWFYPGDLAELLPSGHIALRGRDKDVIIRGGVNIYPAEIEAVLLGHPEVREAAVIGHQDPARGEIVKAFIAGAASEDSIRRWCAEQLAPYKQPQDVVILNELPKSNSGKIDKKSLLRD